MNLFTSLGVRGFRLEPWTVPHPFHHVIGTGSGNHCFRWQDFDGLLAINDLACIVIALDARKPGSGGLPKLFDELESAVRECDLALVVSPIWNDRLFDWFRRRGYYCDKNPVMGRFAAAAWSARHEPISALPQPVRFLRCTYELRQAGIPNPRTCEECGLGPCKLGHLGKGISP